jgi:hypothetical protein
MHIITPDITRMISACESAEDGGRWIGLLGELEASDTSRISDVEGVCAVQSDQRGPDDVVTLDQTAA